MWEAERPGPRAFLRHEGVRMRQVLSRGQPSPLRRRFPSFSRSALRPATMTRSRPSFFAWYIAASALAISSSGVSPCVGYSAAPTLTVYRPAPKSSAATRARRRSPTAAAVAIGASISITTNSSPPYRATLSTPRVVCRRISAILTSAASPPRCPWVSLYCLKWSTSASKTEKVRRSRRDRCTSLASVPIRCRRLYSPVSASVTESRSSSPWPSRSRTRATRFLNTCVTWPTSPPAPVGSSTRSEEHTSELQSLAYLVCRLLLEKKKNKIEYCQSYMRPTVHD